MVDPLIFFLIFFLGLSLGIKVISTQNPVYSGLYLVLLFFIGSSISFLLGLEFIALLFLLVYAGAIAVLVLFVVMMLNVKAIENLWSAKKKRLLYVGIVLFLGGLMFVGFNYDLLFLTKTLATTYISVLVSFRLFSYKEPVVELVHIHISVRDPFHYLRNREFRLAFIKQRLAAMEETKKRLRKELDVHIEGFNRYLEESEMFIDFFRLCFDKKFIRDSFQTGSAWFIEFDTACALNDPSYLLYSTHAILLIIAGIVLLIAMVGAISLTSQRTSSYSVHRQLGRDPNNALFSIREKVIANRGIDEDSKALM